MDVVALIAAVLAGIAFAVTPTRTNLDTLRLGLVLLTVALIFQFIHLTGHVVTVN